jgi:hypothetical protein
MTHGTYGIPRQFDLRIITADVVSVIDVEKQSPG